jgi:DNA-binding MarR family transcriptional regulator
MLSPSLTGVLARMEELGLVERNRMPADQRRMLVRLTRHSRDMVARIAPLIEAQYALVEARLGKPLMDELHRSLDRLLGHELESLRTVDLPPVAPPSAAPRTPRGKAGG